MKRFKTYRCKKKNYTKLLVGIILTTFFLINFYNKKIAPKVVDIAETKIEEVTNIYIKKNIVPKNVDLNELITLKKNGKEEIESVDINTNYANEIMINVITKIQNNIFAMKIDDKLLKKKDDNIYLLVPLFLAYDGVLFSNLGPKIPIKISFYEHAFGNIELELVDYGINNALLKVYLEVYLEQKLYIPYKKNNKTKSFRLLIGSKIVNGKVPQIYGGMYKNSVSTVNS